MPDAGRPRVSSDVGLADWLLALGEVRGARERRAELAALLGLGFSSAPGGTAGGEREEGDDGRAPDPARPIAAASTDGGRAFDVEEDEPDESADELPLPARVTPLERVDADAEEGALAPPSWLGAFAMPVGKESPTRSRPPLDPLLVPRWTRSVLVEVLAGTGASREIDVPRLIDDVAARRLVRALPLLRRRTLAHGVQLLLDRGAAMAPFFRDQEDLLRHARATVGREKVDVVRFMACPGRGAGRGARTGWGRWTPPPTGTPVVVVTDLGIGRPPAARDRAPAVEWRAFVRSADEAGCPLLAFVPYARRRWPRGLGRSLTIVPWDRSTSADLVRRHLAIGGDG